MYILHAGETAIRIPLSELADKNDGEQIYMQRQHDNDGQIRDIPARRRDDNQNSSERDGLATRLATKSELRKCADNDHKNTTIISIVDICKKLEKKPERVSEASR